MFHAAAGEPLSGDAPALCRILEAAERVGAVVEHACGGQARCGACRVRIEDGLPHCSPKSNAERALTTADPRERLACQARFIGAIAVRALGPLPPEQRDGAGPVTPRVPGYPV